MIGKTVKISKDEYENLLEENNKLKNEVYKSLKFDCKNEKAFLEDFGAVYDKLPVVLVTFTIDVEKVNTMYGRDEGTKVLSDIVKQMSEEITLYHIQGEKFNIFYKIFDEEKYKDIFKRVKIDNRYTVPFYIGVLKTSDFRGASLEEFRLSAVKQMYAMKHKEKPKDSEIAYAEMEKERLEKEKVQLEGLVEERKDLLKAVEEETKKQLQKENDEGLKSIFSIAQNIKDRDKEKEKSSYLDKCNNEHLIPFTKRYSDTDNERSLETMWFSKTEMRYAKGENVYRTIFYVFPYSYDRTDRSLDIIACFENNGKLTIAKGNMLDYGFNTIKFNISARFSKEGKLITNIALPPDVKVLQKNEVTVGKGYTPDKFGKVLGDKMIFPIRKGMNGYADSVIYHNGEISLTNGIVNDESGTHYINLTKEKVYIE